MSVQTIYKCDKCSKEQPTMAQFWEISISANTIDDPRSGYPRATIQVCRACLESYGIYAKKETKEAVGYSPPSTEELILEVLGRCGIQPTQ